MTDGTAIVLERAGLLDGIMPEDQIFDRISNLAARTLRVPVALVSLVGKDKQVFKGMEGSLPEPWQTQRSTPLSHSFCQHVQASGDALIIADAREHPLVRDNLAVPELGVISYLGVPLTASSGHVLGSLCLIDHQPRHWTTEDVDILRGLASLTMIEIEMRLGRNQLQSSLSTLQANQERRNERTRLLVHDLRTPLNSLLLGLKTIPMLGDLNVDQTEAFELALRGGQTLVELVDDLLDTEEAEEGGRAALRVTFNVDAVRLMARAGAQVSALAAHRGLTLSIDGTPTGESSEPQIVTLDTDEDKTVRALVNLISNAVKFTPAGGRVSVSVRTDEGADGGMAVFSVRDTGVGIAGADLQRIFERYVHLDRPEKTAQRSSGLGLSFVKAVAEAHGGRVEVDSIPGKGSIFSLMLPRKQALRALP